MPSPRPAPPAQAAVPPPPPPDPGQKPVVLLVDNDGGARIPAAQALNASSCQTIEAKNGQEALELLMKTTPDLIVMDVALPIIDGLEVARIVRSQPTFAMVPVVLLSARLDKAQSSFVSQFGATELVKRPIAPADLVFRCWRLLTARGFTRLERTGTVGRPADAGGAGRIGH